MLFWRFCRNHASSNKLAAHSSNTKFLLIPIFFLQLFFFHWSLLLHWIFQSFFFLFSILLKPFFFKLFYIIYWNYFIAVQLNILDSLRNCITCTWPVRVWVIYTYLIISEMYPSRTPRVCSTNFSLEEIAPLRVCQIAKIGLWIHRLAEIYMRAYRAAASIQQRK